MPTKKERLAALEIAQQLNQERIADLIVTVSKLTAGVENLAEGVVSIRMANGILSAALATAERKLNELTAAFALHNNAVVDGQAILGREQATLAARLDKLEQRTVGQSTIGQPFVWPYRTTDEWREGDPLPQTTPFPTGAATTLDEVLAAMPPADDGPPRRGDRVRLEGARTVMGHPIKNGWYDVLGLDLTDFDAGGPEIQVRLAEGDVRWAPVNDCVKEIRRGTAPTVQSEVDDKDLDV